MSRPKYRKWAFIKRIAVFFNSQPISDRLSQTSTQFRRQICFQEGLGNMEDQSLSIGSSSTSSASLATQTMSVEEKYQIVRRIGKECVGEDELRTLLAKKPEPICYDGFEPSGRMHIAQGVMKSINVNKLTSAGCRVRILIADWFALMNNKMGGDLKKIETIGLYMIEIWKAVGMLRIGDKVEFIWSSKEINARSEEYLPLVLDIAVRNTLSRVIRCSEIMGRSEKDDLTGAHIVYPCMQCADVFFLEADICQMGMDQREVNVLAREYCDQIERKNKPIILSHHMLPGLQQGQEKMSTSDPSSAVYMEDEEADVNVKIKKAYCPPQIVDGNPCLEYIQYIVLPWFNEFKVERNADHGGDKTYKTFEELKDDFSSGALHPGDVKPALSKAINQILQPVRDHFKNDPKLKDLLKRVKSYRVTRDNLVKKDLGKMENQSPPSADLQSLSIGSSSSSSASPSTQTMIAEEKYHTVRSIGEECIQEDELRTLLAKKLEPICYDGFEPSGRMHIAQGVMKAINVNKLTSAGARMRIWIADWFAQMNNKMGGDLNKIETIGLYLIEIWRAVGMLRIEDKVEFIWSSKEINARSKEYLPLVLDIARRNTLSRITRCSQIMGRSEKDDLSAAQIFYPCMQCADVFFLKADICQLGMDQRKVNVLAREYCDQIKRKNKPIILSHHMLPGLQQGQEKMSKSDPSSAIYMEDEEEDVNVKIMKAYCPPEIVDGNPCLEYIQYIVLPWFNEFKVERNADHGGDKTYKSFQELKDDFASGALHPGDVKPALSRAINQILQPVRDHFKNDPKAKDLLERVKSFRVTR